MDKSLVLVKPDAVASGQSGLIISRLEEKGLRLVAAKMLHMDRELAERHYAVHRDKPFFADLVEYITSGPVMALILEGEGAVERIREIMGTTDPAKAAPGTIRRDFGINVQSNATHASDSLATAGQEIALFFTDKEIFG